MGQFSMEISANAGSLLSGNQHYLFQKLGEDGIGLGSDFDGAPIPQTIRDAAGLAKLIDAFRKHGYGDVLIEKIASRNWISLLERTIG